MVCLALGWNPQNSYILLLLIQVACCGLFCIRLKSPEQLHFVASYSSGVLWFALHQVEIPRTVTFCCFLFKLHVVVCLALGWNPQNSYILLLLIQVASCGLFCIRLKSQEQLDFVASYSSGVLWLALHQVEIPRTVTFICLLFKWRVVVCLALGWKPQKSFILLLLIQVASCGLFCIRLKSPEQLHFVASYSSGVLWLALHQVEIPRTVTFSCLLFKWRVVVCLALGWKTQNSFILLLLIQVACCGLFCIRLKSPEQLHFVASYSSCMLWFALH